MDEETRRLLATRYSKVKAEKDKLAQAKLEEERLAAEKLAQLERDLDTNEANIDNILYLETLEDIHAMCMDLFGFLMANMSTLKSKYEQRAIDYVIKIVQAISSNTNTSFNIFGESAVHATAIKTLMDDATTALGMDPIDIEWMDTDHDAELAQTLFKELNPEDRSWHQGLTPEQIDRIQNIW